MTVHHTSLVAGIRGDNASTGVVVIHSHERNRCTTAQATVLKACNELKLPTWFMAMDVFGGRDPLPELFDLVDSTRRFELTNKGNNVFNQSELDQQLKGRGVNTLVVLGEVLHSCVRMSIESIPLDKQGPAALDLGYRVRTSPLVLLGTGQTLVETSAKPINVAVQMSLLAMKPEVDWHTMV